MMSPVCAPRRLTSRVGKSRPSVSSAGYLASMKPGSWILAAHNQFSSALGSTILNKGCSIFGTCYRT